MTVAQQYYANFALKTNWITKTIFFH